MSEICNNCGHPQAHHEPKCFGISRITRDHCPCTSFTARPDEPKGDKGLTMINPSDQLAQASSLLEFEREANRQLRSQLQAERTRRVEAEQIMNEVYKRYPTAGTRHYFAKYPAQDSAQPAKEDNNG